MAVIEDVQGAAREQVAYMVDMAKADALDLLGESGQAWELVERYVGDTKTISERSGCARQIQVLSERLNLVCGNGDRQE